MSKNERLFEAIGEVGEDLIAEAEWQHFASPWRRWSGAVAALLAVAILSAVMLPFLRYGAGSGAPKMENAAQDVGAAPEAAPADGIPMEAPAEEAIMEEPAETPAPEPEEDPFADNPVGTDGITPEEPEEEVVEDLYGDIFPVETEADFWKLFPELDMQSMVDYMDTHPGLAENGWSEVVVSQPVYDDAGKRYEETGILTTNGDQVLVIDVPNRILLVRVRGETVSEEIKSEQPVTYQGVLAIAKDPSRLSLQVGEHYGVDGDLVGDIAQTHDGVLAINASGVIQMRNGDIGGGVPAGYVRADGRDLNGASEAPYDRLELGEDNFLRITSGDEPLGDDVTDAMEFIPAMVVDGQMQEAVADWDGLSPRTCIAQRENGELLMLVIEGRLPGYSEGTDLTTCVKILQEYDAWQAMALNYGTDSMMWYDGQYVTKSSVEELPKGRLLPNAFVYSRKGG